MTAPTADPVRLARARERLARAGVVVLLEDHLVLGVAKAAGVLSQGGPPGAVALTDLVEAYRREAEGKPGRAFVGLVHRLDRNVSGAMVVAKSSKAASRLSASLRTREGVEKTYLAWVAGAPSRDAETLRSRLVRDEEARTTRVVGAADDGEESGGTAWLEYEVEARGPGAARLRVVLHTGATHQIRAQLSAAGLPLWCDAKYGGPPAPAGAPCQRPALHALRLSIPHPVGRAPVVVEAPVPDDLRRLDRALGLAPALGEARAATGGAGRE